jgi:DNA-binding transcriptional regulator YiaG
MRQHTAKQRFSGSKLRDARGSLSIEAIASAVGKSADTVRNWEAGRTEPVASLLAILASLTRKPLAFFFTEVHNDRNNQSLSRRAGSPRRL